MESVTKGEDPYRKWMQCRKCGRWSYVTLTTYSTYGRDGYACRRNVCLVEERMVSPE